MLKSPNRGRFSVEVHGLPLENLNEPLDFSSPLADRFASFSGNVSFDPTETVFEFMIAGVASIRPGFTPMPACRQGNPGDTGTTDDQSGQRSQRIF